jgi:hypothetical protein
MGKKVIKKELLLLVGKNYLMGKLLALGGSLIEDMRLFSDLSMCNATLCLFLEAFYIFYWWI